MAIDIEEAKKFIKDADNQSRNLELEKARLEQQQEYAEKGLKDNETKMQERGCTPATIGDVITDKSTKAQALRIKIEDILNKAPNGNE